MRRKMFWANNLHFYCLALNRRDFNAEYFCGLERKDQVLVEEMRLILQSLKNYLKRDLYPRIKVSWARIELKDKFVNHQRYSNFFSEILKFNDLWWNCWWEAVHALK